MVCLSRYAPFIVGPLPSELPRSQPSPAQTLSSIRKPHPGLLGMQPKVGSAGILLPGQEARIVREDGTLAAQNEPGELWLRGPNVALGYWRNPQATEATFGGGWLRTGDVLKVDKDGFF